MIAVFKISFNLLLPISKGVHLTFSFNLVALVEVSLAYNKRNLELQPTGNDFLPSLEPFSQEHGHIILYFRDKMKPYLLKFCLFALDVSDECSNGQFVKICTLAFLYYSF